MIEFAELTDEEIVRRIQKGDKEAFGALMERYYDKLKRYGKKFLSEKENIEDIVQDVFLSAYQNIQGFNTSLKFSSWIYRIAHNAFVNGLRKQQRSAVPHFDLDVLISYDAFENPIASEREAEDLKNMIETGLDRLQPKYKEAIILHYIEDLSYKEIGDILEIPTGTVGVRVMRGKEALRKIYQELNPDYE